MQENDKNEESKGILTRRINFNDDEYCQEQIEEDDYYDEVYLDDDEFIDETMDFSRFRKGKGRL